MKILNSPILAMLSFGLFIAVAIYSYNATHRDFIDEQLSQYDDSKTKPYIERPNIKTDNNIRYRNDIAALYNVTP